MNINQHFSEKEKILNFTHDMFVTEGFYKTSMDEIARDLQMSKKTIYKYFSSKEQLVEDVCNLRIDRVEKMIDDIINTSDDTVTKFVKLMVMNNSMMKNCSEKWFRDLQHHAPHMLKKFDKLRDEKIYLILTKLLEQGKKEKLLENVPPQVLIRAYIGAITFVTEPEFILNNKFSLQEVFRITTEVFFNGFLTEQGKQKYANTKKLFANVLS